jgi:hypothetical protein
MAMHWSRKIALVCVIVLIGVTHVCSQAGDTKATITFSEGHGTDARDGGRPVVLIAAALGVKPEIFCEAFSGVKPAKDGKPTKDEARRNKEALMKVLKPHGVTNERLDEVSDYYRYKPGKRNLWKAKLAQAYAVLEGGKVKRIVVTDPGHGYSTPPKATVAGMESLRLKVTIQFSKDFSKNGSVSSVEVE